MPLGAFGCTAASMVLQADFGEHPRSQAKRRAVSTNRRMAGPMAPPGRLAHRRLKRHRGRMKIGIIGAGAIGGWIAAGWRWPAMPSPSWRAGTRCRRCEMAWPSARAASPSGPRSAHRTTRRLSERRTCWSSRSRPRRSAGVASPIGPMIGPETLILPMLNGVPWWFLDGEPLSSVDPGRPDRRVDPIGTVDRLRRPRRLPPRRRRLRSRSPMPTS